ncbi:MAG: hypothetical protein RLZZ500_2653 [Bacteroidota bacterium]
MNKSLRKLYTTGKTIVIVLILMYNQFVSAQCPTVTNSSQTFCNTESPTIANLAATDNGGGVAWFSSTTATTPLTASSGLINGATYYADNATGDCGSRQPVTVTIFAAPTGQNFQGVCVDDPNQATIANLIAIGNNIQWYTSSSGGAPLPTTTVLVDNTIYYASQTNPNTGCETSRLAVFVTVGVVPVPTGPALQSFCLNGTTPTIANLQASGTNNWYSTASSAVILDPNTPLVDGENYYATTLDPPCESVNRLEVTVQLLQPNNAGNDGAFAVCSNDLATNPIRNLFSSLSGSPQTGGTWTGPLPTSNGDQGTVNISTLTAAGSPYVFTYSVSNAACPTDTATVTITISNPVNAGNDATTTVCSNAAPFNLFTLLGVGAQAGGTWSPPLASGTNTFNPAVDTSGTYTYTVLGTPGCPNDTATVTVTVNPATNSGANGSVSVCAVGPSVNLFTSLGGTPQAGGTWSPALASGTGVFNPLVDAPGTYTYTVTGTPPCANSSSTVTVTLTPATNPTFTQVAPICQGGTLAALPTTSNNGITGTWAPALNNNATTTYTFTPSAGQCATTATMTITVNPNVTPTFTQVAPICQGGTLAALPTTSTNGITGTWSPALNNNATTTYTFTPSAGQCATTATMTITVNPNLTPTFTQVPPICRGGTLSALPTTSNNGVTGTWSPALNNNNTTTYTFTPSAGQCSTTATMTITVNPNVTPTFTQVPPICQGGTLAALPTTSNNGITGTWAPALNNNATTTYTFTPSAGQCSTTATMTITVNPNVTPTFTQVAPICQGGTLAALPTTSNNGITGTWAPALNNTTTTTYTFTPNSTANCELTTTMTIVVNPLPNAGNDGATTLCSNNAAVDLFSLLGGTPQTGGVWTPAMASGTGLFNPSVDPAGTYTYTVNGIAPCGSDSAEVVVTVVPAPNAGIDGTATFCADSAPADLFTFLGGTPQTGGVWSPALASGTGVYDPLVDTAGVYTYTITGTAPCADATASASVTVNPIPFAGLDATLEVCANSGVVDLYFVLGGTPDANGTWSPALASGTSEFDPSVDLAGTYTYTVIGDAPCGSDSSTLVITIIPAPNAGTDGTANFCADSAPADLFTFLGGTPQTGGTWSPALASGTGVFDPALDTAGTYTYTVTGTAPCADATASATVIVNPIPDAGTDGAITLCSNAPSVDLFNSLTGTPMTGGTWTPALASGTGIFDPTVDAAGTYTYTVAGIAPCGNDTAIVTVTVITAPNAGTDGTANFCADSAPADLFTFLGGTPQTGGTWTPALASGTGVFDPTLDTAGTYTYTVTGTAPCTDATASATVIVNPIPDAGTDGAITLCSNGTSVDLFNSLTGTPMTGGTWTPALASGTGVFDPTVDTAGTYIYTVTGVAPCGNDTATVTVTIITAPNAGTDGTANFCADSAPADLVTFLGGTPQTGGTWSPALASGTGVFDPALDTAGTYTYTVTGTAPCADATASATVIVNPIPNAGTDGSIALCSDATPVDLFNSLTGTPMTGGTWTPALASGTGVFDPTVDTAGTYTYTVAGIAPCGNDTATVTVTIITAPNAGTDGTANFCADSAPTDLFTFLGGTPQTGGTWSPALASGTGVFNPAVDTAGSYTYTVNGIAPCFTGSASATVTVNPIPNAGQDGTITLCSNATAVDLFASLGGTPQTGGTWSPALASGTGLYDPTVDAAGTYTYTINGIAPCGTDNATVTVTITAGPNAGADASVTFCANGASSDLFTALGVNAQTGGTWSPPLVSGTGVFNPALDFAGQYTYTVPGTGTCNPDTAIVTVSITTPPNFGAGTLTATNVCQNTNVVVTIAGSSLVDGNYTFDYSVSNANPTNGTTTTVTITSGGGQFTIPGTYFQTAGATTITLNAVTALAGNCTTPNIGATTTLTVLPLPTLGNATVTIANSCLGTDATVAISGATTLANGTYTLTYQVSGANTSSATINVVINNGSGTFIIPNADLINAGVNQFSIATLISQITTCGNSTLNFTPVSFTIENPTAPTLTGTPTFCIDANATIADLTALLNGNGTIIWYATATGGTALNATDVLQDGITYYAAVQSTAGCESTRLDVVVTVEQCLPDAIIIPDGFSPNNDGVNDEFVIKNIIENYPNFTIEIFNRYGNVLFNGNRNNPNWNGKSSEGTNMGNGYAPAGVYFYILNFNDGSRAPIQGRLYLSR